MARSKGQRSGQKTLDAEEAPASLTKRRPTTRGGGGAPARLQKRGRWTRPGDPHPAQDPPHQQEAGPQGRGRQCVLLVDDEELITQVGQEMLDSLGYEAVTRTSSAEALETFREAPQRFDLVITDYNMPHMPGDVLAHELRCLRPDVPIILCTGGSTMTSETTRALGFDAFLRKPFGPHDIALAIQEALAQRALQKT